MLQKEQLIEFNQLAMSNAEGSHDMINRVMTKDNIGLCAVLETKDSVWEHGTVPRSSPATPPHEWHIDRLPCVLAAFQARPHSQACDLYIMLV